MKRNVLGTPNGFIITATGEPQVKILLRNPQQLKWQKLEPRNFGGDHGEEEFQRLLEESPDLLPTDAGGPVLFFRSKVPLGSNEVDLLGVNAEGMIVVVECKLEANREARRMVVGQVLEYASQLRGMSYEKFDELLTSESGRSLMDTVRQHLPNDASSEEGFRARIERGLTNGDFHLVIAINGMNDDLEGTIEYLNTCGGLRLVALELQQFTDERTKTEVLVPEIYGGIAEAGWGNSSRQRRMWDWESFVDDATQKGLGAEQIGIIKRFYNQLQSNLRAKIEWGSGTTYGYFGAKWPFSSACPLGVASNGRLSFGFVSMGKTEAERVFRTKLRDLAARLGFAVPNDFENRWPSYGIEKWSDKAESLIESLGLILPEI